MQSLTLTLAVLTATPLASAYCRTTEPPSAPGTCELHRVISWPITCVGVSIDTRELASPLDAGQDLTALLRAHIAPSLRAWSDASCGSSPPSLSLVLAGDVETRSGMAFDGRNTVSINRRWTYDAFHRPGTIAITVVTRDARTATILEADVELNAVSMQNPLGRTFSDGLPTWGVADMPSVLLHELGHVTGLDHSLVGGAVMQSSMDVERRRRALTSDDVAGVCAQYPVSATRPRASADCAPERAVARASEVLAGGGCSTSRARGGRAELWAAMLAAMGARRRRGWRAALRP